jgi:hypothetical protein
MAPKRNVTRGGNGGANRPRASQVIVVNSDDDDGESQATASEGNPVVASPTDAALADDLAEAHALGIDEEFIEQLRIMSPRSRATILTDLRQSAVRDDDHDHHGSVGGGVVGGGGNAPSRAGVRVVPPRDRHRRATGRRNDRRYAEQDDDDEHDAWEDEDEDDPESPWVHQHRHGGGPPGNFPGFPVAAGDGNAAIVMLMQHLLGGGGRRGGGRGHGRMAVPRGMEEYLHQMQAQAEQARAMGADLDVDHMSYEDLLALQERVGHVSKGLGKNDINRVSSVCPPPSEPSPNKDDADGDADSCVICMTEYAATKDNDCRRIHACGHLFHDACLSRWFKDNKRCPICNREAA